ncbi:vitamin K epoxide reductase family protein [Salinibacterium sp. SYSU T00001]|uniref:vitamin K epoxide reductase family protein n=1 Tax=Homoserinimonas sedimenticola TaxID=2986805 RepID=UPI002236344B|nr:vitamin K epoxide reductase family protein [Salinibacterium sedimenticola]MCW4384657.1 vitamin K epoxide reductase family protein [Salinibacterium sedimenticola]
MADALLTPGGRRTAGIIIAALGVIGWIVCFVSTLQTFEGMDTESPLPVLILGIPATAAGLVACTLLIGTGVVLAVTRADAASDRRPVSGSLLALAAAVGLLAAWSLTADKVVTLTEPNTELECNFSLLVQCGANLASWQGALFGFPNPLLGLVGWSAVLVVAAAMFAGVRLPTWLWSIFTLGVVGAMAFVIWLISQSIFVLNTLCPWCMVTWAVTIPVFWYCLGEWAARSGRAGMAKVGRTALGWLPLLTVLGYLTVAVVAQIGLDLISYL